MTRYLEGKPEAVLHLGVERLFLMLPGKSGHNYPYYYPPSPDERYCLLPSIPHLRNGEGVTGVPVKDWMWVIGR